jgi:hypothetical protein
MTTLVDLVSPRFAREQVEAAILAIPLERFTAALRFGLSDEDGCRLARAQMVDDVIRELDRQLKTPAR